MRRRMAVSRAAAAVVLASTLTAACGIGEQDDASRINPADLEGVGLAEPVTTAPAPSAAPPPVTRPEPPERSTTAPLGTTAGPIDATLYFIMGAGISPVVTEVPPDLSVRGLLRALERAPGGEEDADGVRSALPVGLVRSVYRRADSITVNLGGELFATVDNQDQQLLFAQIVLTLTDLPPHHDPITRVRFTLDGEPLSATRRDNTLSEPGAFVTRWDYQLLVDTADRTEEPTESAGGTAQ